ncbi:hydroxyethylthiazole kinase [Alkaliphilus oremlandii]|uniref:Hydroxyethylthiazole kinase n=1 Tax=Alkaliphilus oremlandii (strain OhILAs) TaxID=350688 RepID=THIM_ALKOO|nr:hydroxyethylthiazole kinase [Alkaliphilus oremlandii]A8MK93.1 RecName: Full=Hydroxyethylthiazole kinase; AltName: Full=4-methyl-5-beta-hydroxyethylthiazole kinase; Short=TH kinase; Short=Thz kinase [Alkaliphilus oremlandii OhILAs]ABW20225.1 Hydroxyethylthiazole kinase [Alkaliphilus oremlandii OhILAs]
MELKNELCTVLEQIKEKTPLVHHITNYVTVNDCANITLAIGGSPVMADDHKEVEDMVSIASAVVLNIGTLNERTIESFVLAGKKANELNIPVILDPVGAGATAFRSQTIEKILKEVKLSVLRGNMSEIKNIYGTGTQTKGVDSVDSSLDGGKEIAISLAKKLSCTVVITGEVDIVSDGNKTYAIQNGHKALSSITGTGCMSASLIGACCGTGKGILQGAILGTMIMGIAGEKANERLKVHEGLGSFKVYLMDAVSNFDQDDIRKRGKVDEI